MSYSHNPNVISMDLESFEKDFEPQPLKRKRSSILKPPPEKRTSRDSRTVSFNDRYIYKELHQDGTCDITNHFLGQDMDLTMMDIIEPVLIPHDRTIDASIDMSLDRTGSILDVGSADNEANCTLTEERMIDTTANTVVNPTANSKVDITVNSRMDTTVDQKGNSRANSTVDTIVNSRVDTAVDTRRNSRANSTIDTVVNTTVNTTTTTTTDDTTLYEPTNISLTSVGGDECSLNETYFGAFHDSNEMSRLSEADTLVHNVEALQACIQKVDQSTKLLDDEIEDLLKFYKHIVNKDNKYEFAIKIFGLRYGLWLIINVNPETYPNETIGLRFAVNKKDRHLYPFPEYARAVKQYTKEGREGYLTRFVINAQKFRRFLRQYRDKKR